jgi:hypothetical protein
MDKCLHVRLVDTEALSAYMDRRRGGQYASRRIEYPEAAGDIAGSIAK